MKIQDVRARKSEQSFTLNVCTGIIGNMLIRPNHYFNTSLVIPIALFLERVLLDLMFDAPAAIRRNIRFQHDGAPVYFIETLREYLDRT